MINPTEVIALDHQPIIGLVIHFVCDELDQSLMLCAVAVDWPIESVSYRGLPVCPVHDVDMHIDTFSYSNQVINPTNRQENQS